MSRADRRRQQRTRPDAALPQRHSGGGGAIVDDTLFFQRLRVHAKWMFLLLAILFAGTFVLFGVGSNVQGGIVDVFQRGGSGPDVGDAREKVQENPQNAEAQRELATALQADGRSEESIVPLVAYVGLRPSDQDALQELAGLYLTKAGRLREEAQLIQYEASVAAPGTDFLPPATSELGQALGSPPINQAVQTLSSERLSQAYTAIQDAYGEAQATYAKLAKLNPQEPDIQLQLASAAQQAGDTAAALTAYKKFVELAPDHPSTPLVKEQIKQLEAPLGGTTGG
jgi:tetratricopeptide (TPR) repeat protein